MDLRRARVSYTDRGRVRIRTVFTEVARTGEYTGLTGALRVKWPGDAGAAQYAFWVGAGADEWRNESEVEGFESDLTMNYTDDVVTLVIDVGRQARWVRVSFRPHHSVTRNDAPVTYVDHAFNTADPGDGPGGWTPRLHRG